MKRLPLIRRAALESTSVAAINAGFDQTLYQGALFAAARALALIKR